MKSTFIKIATAATIVWSAGAHALPVTDAASGRSTELAVSGSIDWRLSGSKDYFPATGVLPYQFIAPIRGALGVRNLLRADVQGVNGADFDLVTRQFGRVSTSGGGYTLVPVTTAGSYSSPLDGVGLTSAGEWAAFSGSGGMQWTVPYSSGHAEGGQVTIERLTVDMASKTVRADLTGRLLLWDQSTQTEWLGDAVALQDVALWRFDAVQGPALSAAALLSHNPAASLSAAGFDDVVLSPQGRISFAGDLTLTGLRMSSEAEDFITAYFGTYEGMPGDTFVRAANDEPEGWGKMTIRVQFSSAVPEPAAWASMLCGIAVLAVHGRRQRARR